MTGEAKNRSAETGERPRGGATLAVMLSGGGRTLENLLAQIDGGRLHARVGLVIASRECRGAEIGRERGVPTVVEPGDIPAARLAELVRGAGAEWIVLAGYLRHVRIPSGFEDRVVNIHPALLPNFGGPGMFGMRVHRAVLKSGVRETGCTVHMCDAEYDRGPVVLQKRCEVRPGDTVQMLADRVFELEKAAYPEALEQLVSGRVRVVGGRVVGTPGPGRVER